MNTQSNPPALTAVSVKRAHKTNLPQLIQVINQPFQTPKVGEHRWHTQWHLRNPLERSLGCKLGRGRHPRHSLHVAQMEGWLFQPSPCIQRHDDELNKMVHAKHDDGHMLLYAC